MSKIKHGDTVTVHYTGTTDGEVFDTSKQDDREALTFTIGEGQLIPGFENGVIGHAAGETITINIPSNEAYGEHEKNYIIEVPLDKLPADVTEGSLLNTVGPQGPIMVKVVAVNETTASVDHNHPLAGKDLTFEIEILEVVETPEVVE